MSAGPGDAERLPWLEPYREPGTTAAVAPRGSRVGLAAVAMVGLAGAIGGAYWLGQQRAAPEKIVVAARSEPPAVAAPVAVAPAPVAAATAEPTDATPSAAKPKVTKSAADKVRVHRGPQRPRKLQERPLETGQLATVLDTQKEERAWPMMPSPGPAGQVIQLGAFTTPTKAQRAYARRTERYPLLATMPKVIVPVATKPTGQVLYVLRLGTQTPEQAAIVCRNLKNSGDHCLVIG